MQRAKYNGPAPVVVHHPAGRIDEGSDDYLTFEVVPGGLLPKDAPAALRDELLTYPDWSAAKDPGGSKPKGADTDDKGKG